MGSRTGLAALVLGCALLAACGSSGPAPDTSPLPSTATSGQFACAFVDKVNLQTALGVKDLDASDISVSGGPNYYQGQQHNADGGRLAQATCTVTDLSHGGAQQAFGVQVEAAADRSDLAAQVKSDLAGGRTAAYRFPADYGTGLAYSADGARVELLRGIWLVLVGIESPGKGRDAVQDAVALTRQIVTTLQLSAAAPRS